MGFLHLPAEIRVMIYNHLIKGLAHDCSHQDIQHVGHVTGMTDSTALLRRTVQIHVSQNGKTHFRMLFPRPEADGALPGGGKKKPQRLAFLLACRLIYIEALEIVYDHTLFTFEMTGAISDASGPTLRPNQWRLHGSAFYRVTASGATVHRH
jgi:hypothetical protein